jgi:hypothetical protein
MKSITQQSKISMTRIGFKGIMWCFKIDPNFWKFSQVLQNACVSLNMVGQQNPHCKIFAVVFFDEKWPLHASEWQNLITLLTSLSGMHLRNIWLG